MLRAFVADQRGATSIEYGMICALIFLVIVTSVTSFANKATNLMARVSTAIGTAVGP